MKVQVAIISMMIFAKRERPQIHWLTPILIRMTCIIFGLNSKCLICELNQP